MNPWNELLANMAIVAITTSIWTFSHRHVQRHCPAFANAIFGVIMAAGTSLVMLLPFQFQTGVFLDLRYTFLTIAGLFGGPLAGALTAATAVAMRLMQGGLGIPVGLSLICLAAACGQAAHLLKRSRAPGIEMILGVSLSVVFSGTIGFFFKVPMSAWVSVMPAVVLPFAILLFVSCVMASLALAQEIKRQDATNENRVYRAIIEALPDCLNAKDLQGRFIAANPATAELMNAASVDDLIGKSDFDFYPEATARVFQKDEETLLQSGKAAMVEQRFFRADNREAWLITLKAPLRNEQGELVGMITHNRDITERKKLQGELLRTQQLLSDAMASMEDGLAMFDETGAQVLCNARYLELFPLTADIRTNGTCMRQILRAAIERGEDNPVRGNMEDFIERTADTLLRPGDRQMRLADGRWIQARTRATSEGGHLIVYSDITRSKRSEEELRALNERLGVMALTDSLTGLLNRRAFDEALERAVANAPFGSSGPSLLMIDVDRFKAYNDAYGHPAGDACLKQVAICIGDLMKSYPHSVVARYGGEEIGVIIPNCGSVGAAAIARLLCGHVRGLGIEHRSSERGVVTASIGIASIGEGASDWESLLSLADEALYRAKADGRDRVALIAANGASSFQA